GSVARRQRQFSRGLPESRHLRARSVRHHRPRRRRRVDPHCLHARPQDAWRPEARHLRRAWRRPRFGPFLRGGRARLCLVLALSRADRASRGGAGRDVERSGGNHRLSQSRIAPMGTIYVARSATFSEWASDVGLSKNVFKLGYTDEPPEEVVKANWGGAEDWTIVKKKAADSLDEAEMVANSMATETISKLPKAKPDDLADYLIQNALK